MQKNPKIQWGGFELQTVLLLWVRQCYQVNCWCFNV